MDKNKHKIYMAQILSLRNQRRNCQDKNWKERKRIYSMVC